VEPAQRDRVLTLANAISFARLLGVPLFLYLFLVAHRDGLAVAVLAVGGTSDWIDGYVARRLKQVSRLGELLDPFADRLYIFATVVAFTIDGVLPVVFTVVLLAREVFMGGCLVVLRRYGYGPPPVHYVGKTATFLLLAAFPLLLLAAVAPGTHRIAHPMGWGLAWWGIVLYWLAAGLYAYQIGTVLRGRASEAGT
jgi:cardiolipin synthase